MVSGGILLLLSARENSLSGLSKCNEHEAL